MNHFVEYHAQRPTVALFTVEGAKIGFGGHIGGRSNVEGFDYLLGPYDLAKTKIYDCWIEVFGNENVSRLEISVDDATLSNGVAANQYFFENSH